VCYKHNETDGSARLLSQQPIESNQLIEPSCRENDC